MRIGSLFSGYGGLEMGVQAAIPGTTVAWHSEIDPAASQILAHHWPDVPNLGDITTVDWAQVEPVDVLTGGSPCQDVSMAGARKGMRPGTRSGLWASMCDAIEIIRPSLVVWENVRGVLSAGADSNLEPCAICVGDERESHLRALGRVVGDLAELGYVGRWTGLRAADVGAPHGRFRVFVAAWPAEYTDCQRLERPQPLGLGLGVGERVSDNRGEPAADADGLGRERGRGPRDGWPRPESSGRGAPADTDHAGRGEQRWRIPAQPKLDPAEHPGNAAPDADGDGLEGVGRVDALRRDPHRRDSSDTAWGDYEPAVRRWEACLGRPAPAPTEPGAKGGQRLSPAFVEWLMGLPAGHVTAVPGLSRNDQLKALGNGVVPAQAAEAIRRLLTAT